MEFPVLWIIGAILLYVYVIRPFRNNYINIKKNKQ